MLSPRHFGHDIGGQRILVEPSIEVAAACSGVAGAWGLVRTAHGSDDRLVYRTLANMIFWSAESSWGSRDRLWG